ncbi:MAG: ankyrin repeat domain-containing protein [Muricauda sp.]|jgi:ankyrin repeat protein|nr:ankyrin repeat domain-containing protein [Allomuricauda sp.]MBO6531573.1 ankyrin repeat domain-containing protein [Allomuricauda sp.]MBO6589445.1 ankyrin repeat domain-containing protein [Allomuricauda sp.]MBO6619123.1 ankyrin repeat domain-containing protein [Allomuricauda sp.]MBO6644981.1 ankyrin repeat domain-containing protein [Allomuricauda sp.]MBO6747244.1 ankyrin repeat domain-containing protein [Allomuricauda sp.]
MKKTIFTVAAFSMLALSGITANEPVATNSTVNLEMVAPDELSAFCKAVMQGDVDTVKKFIELGEDVNQKSLGRAPIHYAARYNKAEVLKVLIENGANLKMRCDGGMTAMKYAKMSNATEAQSVLETAMKK